MSIGFNDLSDLQKQAFDVAYKSKNLATRIVGYAGTGKTTVMAELAKELGSKCVVLAPTNKAASVLMEKGIKGAQTIHSCLYQPVKSPIYDVDGKGKAIHTKNEKTGAMEPKIKGYELTFNLNREGSHTNDLPPIALVDEASMVDEDICKDLLFAFEKVVFFGDGFQLPPVGRLKGALEIGPADFEMNEVHRVAFDNPIIRYATLIRQGEEPFIGDMDFEEIKTCAATHQRLYQTIANKDVQAICYTNRQRHHINEQIRIAKGYEPNTLLSGEPIICLQNIRVTDGDPFEGAKRRTLVMYNGQVSTQDRDFKQTEDDWMSELINVDCVKDLPIDVKVHTWPFWNRNWFNTKGSNNWEDEIAIRKSGGGRFRFGTEFDYSYCMTAHKAQGSEYNKVAVFDERPRLKRVPRDQLQRWFYTAITRAKTKVLVVTGV